MTRPESAALELNAVAESLSNGQRRVVALLASFKGSGRDDIVTALHEVERQIAIAAKAIRIAIKTADQ